MVCIIGQPCFKLNISAIKIEKSKARLRWLNKGSVLCCANDPILYVLHSLWLTVVGFMQHSFPSDSCFFIWYLLHAASSGYASLTVCLENPDSLQMISRSWSLPLTARRQSRVSSVPCLPFLFPITPYGFPQSVMCSTAFRHCAGTKARNVFLSKYSQDDSSRL